MAKNEAAAVVDEVVAAPPVEQVTLNEFCTRLSLSDKRVELIGGFHHQETAKGTIKDAESEFYSRFLAFANKPV